jgi:hypothetical protein
VNHGKEEMQDRILLKAERFRRQSLTQLKKPQQNLRPLGVLGGSGRKSPQKIARAWPKDLISRNGNRLHRFEVFQPKS